MWFVLIRASFFLGHIIPGGALIRTPDESGNSLIDGTADVLSPFTVGVAQHPARRPIFSGLWFRLLSFFRFIFYGDYARWLWKFQLANLLLTSLILLLSLAIGY